ncbi:MAG: nitroreductase [Chloroflexota bacterium]|nr:nitroreductase [Chloroflexota bacterium]MDE2959520.1 nitroreductase [Chloroflexota bacterium]
MTQSSRLRSGNVTAPETDTTVYEAIHNRRMNNEFTEFAPSREALQRMLDAAVWAPNHRLTNPWRFFVLEKGGEKRAEVAQLAYDNLFARSGNHENADGSRQRVLDAPALIYVYSVPADSEEMTQENYAAACCAVQNLLLAAVAEGLAGDWSTGNTTRHPALAETLGGEPDWTMVGALFIGQPSRPSASVRAPADEVTAWL